MYSKMKNHLSYYTPMSILGLAFMLTLNAMAVILPLNGYQTGELSDIYPNLFVPAGVTFSIWGLLYVCLIGFVVFSVIIDRNHTNRHENALKQITPLFFVSCMLNGIWIVCWHYLLILPSLVVMVGLLLTLMVLYNRLQDRDYTTLLERFFMKGTMSLYFGWITVALIANVAAYWSSIGASCFALPEATCTIIVMVTALVLGLYFSVVRKDVLYSAVILWAYLGIYIKHTGFYQGAYPNIVTTSQIGMALLALGILFGSYRIFSSR